MDIYSFINSKDIAEHCRKLNKTWNTYEMAVIIGRSKRPLSERRDAWRELIKNFPNMPTHLDRHDCKYDSIHQELIEILKLNDKVW